MPARSLFRRTARMKDHRALPGWKARQLQFLERLRRHGGNLRPVRDGLRRGAPHFAESSIGGVVGELLGKQFESKRIETFCVSDGRVIRVPIFTSDFQVRASCNSSLRIDELTHSCGEV